MEWDMSFALASDFQNAPLVELALVFGAVKMVTKMVPDYFKLHRAKLRSFVFNRLK